CVRMFAEKNFAKAFAGQKSRLRALEFYLFQFLTAFALEFGFGKRSFAREFVHKTQKRFGEFAESPKGNCTSVLAGAGGKIGAKAPQIFFDFPAGAVFCAGADHCCRHFGESRRAMRNGGVSGTEVQLSVKPRHGMGLDEYDFQAVREL